MGVSGKGLQRPSIAMACATLLPPLAAQAGEALPASGVPLALAPAGVFAASLTGLFALLAAVGIHSVRSRGRLERRASDLGKHLVEERRRLERAHALLAHEASERARTEFLNTEAAAIFEGAPEGILIANGEGRISTVNPAAEAMLGHAHAHVGAALFSVARRMLARPFLAGVLRELRARDAWHGDAKLMRAPEAELPVHLELKALRDSSGAVRHYVATLRDLSAQERSQERILHLTHRDAITDLPNRTLFRDQLARSCTGAERRGDSLALLYLDLDRFKGVNDSLGHPLGDVLLHAVGRRLSASLRADDIVARLGGDEFAVLAEGVRGEEQALTVASKLSETLRRPFEIEGREIFVSASIGVSLFPKHGVGAEDLLRAAESAMYDAKSHGRNRYSFFRHELDAECSERFHLENDLRRALERDELVVFYQPVVSMEDGRIVGAEALVRWRHPELGLVSPMKFIPLAEEMGLIAAIGDHVRASACRDLASWRARGFHDIRVAVNVSGYEMIAGDLTRRLREELEREDLSPACLELEITEGFLLSDSERALRELDALKRLGVTLAVDDFGTGYSSLSYLKRMPIDKLKIDRSFVMQIPEDSDNEAIARAVIALGRSLNLQVVAEGVETGAQRDFMRREGCHAVQGFLYSPPVCAEDFLALLETAASPLASA